MRDGAVVCQYLCLDFSPFRTFCGGVQLLSYRRQSIRLHAGGDNGKIDSVGRGSITFINNTLSMLVLYLGAIIMCVFFFSGRGNKNN